MVAFRNFCRSLEYRTLAAMQVDGEEPPPLGDRVKSKLRTAIKNHKNMEPLDRALFHYDLFIEYRSWMVSLGSKEERRNAVPGDEFKRFEKRITEGSRIASLCYAISPRSIVGIFVMLLMDTGPAALNHMDSCQYKTFESLFITSLGAERGIPSYYHGLVRYVVEGLVPFLE